MSHSDSRATPSVCVICLDNLVNNEVLYETSCSHVFHQSCILGSKPKKCPMCRHPLPDLAVVEEPMVTEDVSFAVTDIYEFDPNCDHIEYESSDEFLDEFNQGMYAYIRQGVSDLVT